MANAVPGNIDARQQQAIQNIYHFSLRLLSSANMNHQARNEIIRVRDNMIDETLAEPRRADTENLVRQICQTMHRNGMKAFVISPDNLS